MPWPVKIAASAFRHGLVDEAVRHAFENSIVVYQIDRDGPSRYLHIGPDRAGNLLELVVIELDSREWLVIHAMKMRGKFEPSLPGLDA